ncbi:MAG: mechanosensitive ion channel, partial [Planctomycetales bacterium]
LFRQICRPSGLTAAHFSWSENTRQAIYYHVRWFLWVFLPLVFVAVAMDTSVDEKRDYALGRICLIIFLVAVIALAHCLLRPRGPLFDQRGVTKSGWTYRLRYFWYAVGVCMPAWQIGLIVWGYVFTAESLLTRMMWTLWMLLGLLVACSMLIRWLRIKRRRLAYQHDQTKRSPELAEEDGAMQPQSQYFVPQKMSVDFDAIGQQSRKLINVLFVIVALIGVWMVWADVLPALTALDNIELWQVTVGERVEGVTLAHLIMAIVVLLFTVLAIRNIPGLLELVVLQRLPMDSAARYATVTMLRYVIALAGIIASCHMLGVVWSNIQWLVAAATVGLGFGLQEIFANFISGLILLT